MSKAMNRVVALAAAAAFAAPGFARADQNIDQTRPLHPDASVSVINCAGSIAVETWDKNLLSLTGRLGEGVEKLLVEGDADKLRIEVKLPRFAHNVEDTQLRLRVPAGVNLDLDSVSADVSVHGTRGSVKTRTVSGDVNLLVDSPSVVAQTISGNLHLEAPSRDTQVKSVSGDLSLKGVRGDLLAETVSGDVHVDGGEFSRLRLKSVSGAFNVEAALADAARAELDTLSGDIELGLPAATNASATLNTSSGDLSSDFAGSIKEDARKTTLTLGTGKAQVSLHSFSGDVQLRKK